MFALQRILKGTIVFSCETGDSWAKTLLHDVTVYDQNGNISPLPGIRSLIMLIQRSKSFRFEILNYIISFSHPCNK